MTEGWWLNSKTGKYSPIHEHADWLSDLDNARKIGISEQTIKKIKKLSPVVDRIEILTLAMNDSLIRIRNHKHFTTFEFTVATVPVLWAIYIFGKKIHFNNLSIIYIANLRTKENFETDWKNFVNKMNKDDHSILRYANKKLLFNYKVKQIANGIFKEIL